VPRHALPFLPDLNIGRQQFRLRAHPRSLRNSAREIVDGRKCSR
jgi:hypothetical protein